MAISVLYEITLVLLLYLLCELRTLSLPTRPTSSLRPPVVPPAAPFQKKYNMK